MNELYEHKKSDAVKWAVVFILIAVLAAGTAGAWTVLLRDGHAGGAEEQSREEAVCPGPAATDGEGNAMESGVVYAMPAAMVFAATAAEQSRQERRRQALTKRRKSTLQSSRRLMDLFIVKN